MKILTKEIKEKLVDNHKQQNGEKEFKAVVKLFNPIGKGTWYLSELNPETNIADGRCVHCGCFMNTKAHWASAECPIGKWGKCEEIKK